MLNFCEFVFTLSLVARSSATTLELLSNLTFTVDTYSEVYALQEDVYTPGNLLYNDGHALLSTNTNTSKPVVVAGKVGYWGYEEGVAEDARFYGITGFVQQRSGRVLVVDKWNHCLRSVDRFTSSTSLLAGNCTDYGSSVGEMSKARFAYPTDILNMGDAFIISDTHNMAIRAIIRVQMKQTVSTVAKGGILRYPKYLTVDSQNNLYITVNDGLVTILANTNKPVALTALKGGYLDGPLALSQFYAIDRIQMVADDMIVVVDTGNRKVRVVDMKNGTTNTLLNLPDKITRSVLITDDGVMFIGAYKHIYEADISVSYEQPNTTPPQQSTPTTKSPVVLLTTTPPLPITYAFTAKYRVECGIAARSADRALLRAVNLYRHKQVVGDACHSDCTVSSLYRPTFTCSRGELSLIWPVTMTSTANMAQIRQRLQSLAPSQYSITMLSASSPVISPSNICGSYVRLQRYSANPDGSFTPVSGVCGF